MFFQYLEHRTCRVRGRDGCGRQIRSRTGRCALASRRADCGRHQLAGLFWALAPDEDVLARLIRKTLYIGVFAFIIGNFNNLAQIIYNPFAGLGIEAGGGTTSQAQLLQPGRLAQVGITAGQPILASIAGLMGFTSFFANFLQIAILLIAWLIVVISFFIMAIQLFISLIEFKLTTLAGFVLVPFGLFGRTAFLAEKVLGTLYPGCQDPRARGHCRHRLDRLRAVHERIQQSTDDQRRAHADPGRIVAPRALDFRAGHRQRSYRRRTPTRRRCCGRNGPHGRRTRGGWRRWDGRRRRSRGSGLPWRCFRYRRRSWRLSRGRGREGNDRGSPAAGTANIAKAGASAAISPLRRAAASLKERFNAGVRAGAGTSPRPAAEPAGGEPP